MLRKTPTHHRIWRKLRVVLVVIKYGKHIHGTWSHFEGETNGKEKHKEMKKHYVVFDVNAHTYKSLLSTKMYLTFVVTCYATILLN